MYNICIIISYRLGSKVMYHIKVNLLKGCLLVGAGGRIKENTVSFLLLTKDCAVSILKTNEVFLDAFI